MTDRNFDDLVDQFSQRIYASSKGRLRLAILDRDIQAHCPHLNPAHPDFRPLQILDAGCGHAHVSLPLAQQGHQLTLCDISARLLDQARARFNAAEVGSHAYFHHGDIQSLAQTTVVPATGYDLVLCHAVMEWVADPQSLLTELVRLTRPGGWLSLMFFNRHSTVLRKLIRGYLDEALRDQFAGKGQGLTPINPLEPEQVYRWIEAEPVRAACCSGIRVFHDYMHKDVRDRRPEEDILELEKRYSQVEPFCSLGRYMHVLMQRNDSVRREEGYE